MKKDAGEYYLKKREQFPDAIDRVVSDTIPPIGKIKKVHLTGICGKAMASLAGLLVAAGYSVTGSDSAWNPPMSSVLEHIGISFKPFDEKNLDGIDVVVIGNASGPSNIEAIAARKKDVPQISSAEAYAVFFIKEARSIVITGTHGKTTTSGLATHVFIESQKSINALVGGVLQNNSESYYYGGDNAEYSVVEGDEYDTAYFDKAPKFLHYRPTIGVITSIEFDHADIYKNMEDYLAAFVFFAQEIPKNGYLLISDAVNESYRKSIVDTCEAKFYDYGFSSDCNIKGSTLRIDHKREGQIFDVEIGAKKYTDFFVPLFGKYNAENALSVIAIALLEGISEQNIKKSISTFKGTEQRQQVLFNKDGIVLIDDFAHHPTAVKVTLEGIRDHYPNGRIIAIFEPRSNTSRRKEFENAYTHAFGAADVVCFSTPIIRHNDDQNAMLDPEKIVNAIQQEGKIAFHFSNKDQILEYIFENKKSGDVFVIMSNGHFDGLREAALAILNQG